MHSKHSKCNLSASGNVILFSNSYATSWKGKCRKRKVSESQTDAQITNRILPKATCTIDTATQSTALVSL